jgi:fructose-1,6-bisphosphatase/inositol monophosphatase family enzyme
MIWDVAAGIAIVEGAGGEFRINKQDYNYPIEVIASNNLIDKSIWAFQ